MGNPTSFPRLRGAGVPEELARAQDNVNITLGPLAEAVSKTPIMGAAPPPWTPILLLNGFTVTGAGQKDPEFQKDALGYVWCGGAMFHAAGCIAGTVAFNLPMGYRPRKAIHFAVKGNLATAQFFNVEANGNVSVEVAVAANGFTDFYFSFLAEQ